MAQPAQTASVTGFRGLDERLLKGTDIKLTTSLKNVEVRNGVVSSRPGCVAMSTTASAVIQRLFTQYSPSAEVSYLYRVTRTKLEYWNGSSWVDITGTMVGHVATNFVDVAFISELGTAVWTQDGQDRPWKIGPNDAVASALGGTPPYARCCEYYVGFLALGNISDDGNTFSHLDIILSDDPDNTWTECSDTELFVTTLTMDETPGPVQRLKVLGADMLCYKSDGIINIRFTPGPVRFQRRRLDFPMGIAAKDSLQSLPSQNRHIFMASDWQLYITDGNAVQPLPPNVQKSLQDMDKGLAPSSVSCIDPVRETYHLFYPVTGDTTFPSGRISYNYKTGEFYKGNYPFEISSAVAFQESPWDEFTMHLAGHNAALTSRIVYTFDSATNAADDAGTTFTSYFDTDWTEFGQPGDKWFQGIEAMFTLNRDARVRISVAVDNESKFRSASTFTLKGRDSSAEDVRVSYLPKQPLFGSWFKLRFEFMPSAATVVTLKEFQPIISVVSTVTTTTPRQGQPSKL